MREHPWTSGPSEILKHGLDLLAEDSDKNRRLAMISIDNSVELMLQTYIRLPKRITNLDIPRKERDNICSNFPSLLDGIEKHAEEKLIGIDLGEVEWFHRLRNELYHQGNGLTVELDKVKIYAELAKVLFKNLYDAELVLNEPDDMKIIGKFMSIWIDIEKNSNLSSGSARPIILSSTIRQLYKEDKISKFDLADFERLRRLRNELVHSKKYDVSEIDSGTISTLKRLRDTLSKV